MADRKSTGHPPAFLPSVPSIRPTIIRGRLCHVLVGVAFTTFAAAASAWFAAEAHRLDAVDAGGAA
jgi:hypothetical protein